MASIFDSPEFNGRLFFPRAQASPTPDEAEDRFIPVAGARLHLRWHRRDAAAPTVLLFHGNGETVADYDDLASSYFGVGANLAVVDYRGYGGSSGMPNLRNTITDAGVVAGVMAAEARRLVVMGRSLGSACAAAIYAAPPAGVIGFIWESGFVDLVALIERRGLTPPPAIPDADRVVFDPLPKLRAGQHPLLVLHGAEDSLISPLEARHAHAEAGTGQKTLQIVPGRGHNDVSFAAQYWEAMARFLTSLAAAGRA